MELKSVIKIAVGVVILLILLALNPFVIIEAGERGVVLNWGAVSETVLEEGMHWRTPFAQQIEKIDVTIQKDEATATASSHDLQQVSSTVAINFHIDPSNVNMVYQNLRHDYIERVIDPAIQEFVKKTTSKYTAEELITKRQEVKEDLRTAIAENLATHHIIVNDLFITNFKFSQSFDNAIEAKVTAEQRALEAKNKLEQVKFEAEQRVAQAEADAEAIRIQAQAVTQQGGKDYVQLQAIEKWNGVLPGQMIPGATVPFINL